MLRQLTAIIEREEATATLPFVPTSTSPARERRLPRRATT